MALGEAIDSYKYEVEQMSEDEPYTCTGTVNAATKEEAMSKIQQEMPECTVQKLTYLRRRTYNVTVTYADGIAETTELSIPLPGKVQKAAVIVRVGVLRLGEWSYFFSAADDADVHGLTRMGN